MRLALVAVSLAFIPSTAFADRSHVAYDTVLPEVFYLEIERDGVKEATFVEPRADGMVALTAPNGTVEYVPLYRVRRVADQDGVDLTKRVRRREWLGTPPPTPKLSSAKDPVVWKPFRFLAGPQSACGSYLITDFAVLWRRGEYRTQHFFVTDLGYARNIGRDCSIGGTIFFGAPGKYGEQLGLRLRVVSWLGRNVSFDIAPGIILWENEPSYVLFKAPGFSSQAGLNLGGRFGMVVQVASVNRRERWWSYLYQPYERNFRETTCHLGIRFGGEMGIAGTAAFAIAETIPDPPKYPSSF